MKDLPHLKLDDTAKQLLAAGRTKDYLALTEALVHDHPEDIDLRLHYVFALLQERRVEAARRQLDAAVTLAPDEPRVLTKLAELRFGAGQFELAEQYLHRARELADGADPVLEASFKYLEGMLASYRGEGKRARTLLQAAVDMGPDNPRHAFYTAALARYLARQGEDGAARDVVRQGLSHHPDDVALHNLERSPVSTDAERSVLEKAVESGDSERAAKAAYELGVLLEDDDLDAARAAYRTAVDSGDKVYGPKAAGNLGLLLADTDPDGARTAYQVGIASACPRTAARAATNLAALLAPTDPDSARAYYLEAVDSGDPVIGPIAAFSLGLVLRQQDDPKAALAIYRRAVDAVDGPRQAEAAVNLGHWLVDHDPEGAREAFQRAIDSDDRRHAAEAAVNLGILLKRLNDAASARVALARAIDAEDALAGSIAATLTAWMDAPR